MKADIEIEGLDEARRRMEQIAKGLSGPPMVQAMRDATLLVQRAAMQNAPVDTGRLRASITPEVVTQGKTVMGIVGSVVAYAPFVELGTRPHWPPLAALEVWARRHGRSAAYGQKLIASRGTPAVRYLQRAVEDNRARIEEIIDTKVGVIIKGG